MLSLREWFDDWFLGAFVNGFSVSLIRPGVLIFLSLVLCLRFGAGIGLPLLFWRPREMPKTAAGGPISGRTRPNWAAQLFVGVGVGVLVWQVLLAVYLFEEFATNYTKDRPPFCESRPGAAPQAPAFGDNDRGYPGRFRYDPLAPESMWLYAAAIASGLAAIGLGVAALTVAWWVVTRVYRLLRYPDWVPYAPETARPPMARRLVNRAVQLISSWEPFRDPTDRTPIPYSPALPAGVLAGLLALSALTTFWMGTRWGLAPTTSESD